MQSGTPASKINRRPDKSVPLGAGHLQPITMEDFGGGFCSALNILWMFTMKIICSPCFAKLNLVIARVSWQRLSWATFCCWALQYRTPKNGLQQKCIQQLLLHTSIENSRPLIDSLLQLKADMLKHVKYCLIKQEYRQALPIFKIPTWRYRKSYKRYGTPFNSNEWYDLRELLFWMTS